MKLRTTTNSLRLRLTRSDVARFSENGTIEESLDFGPPANRSLRFALKRDRNASETSATFDDGRIQVIVPDDEARAWAASDDVAIGGVQHSGDGAELRILVEKDFACLEPRGDEDADTFPNPSAGTTC